MKAPIGVVMTFGLARTPAQVGMLQVLEERGIDAAWVAGTSLGSINSAAYAAGVSTARLQEFWLWLDEDVLRSPVRAIARSVTAKQAAKQEALIRSRLADMLPETFEQLQRPLRLVATDLQRGTAAVLDSGDLVPAVMAASGLPGLIPPVTVAGRHYIDGGFVAGMPLPTLGDDARTMIVLDVGHSATTTQTASEYRWWEVGALAYAHEIREQAVNALVRVAAKMPVVVLSTPAGRLLDFSDPAGMIQAGRQAAEMQLGNLPTRLRRGIYNLPSGLDEFEVLRAIAVAPGSVSAVRS